MPEYNVRCLVIFNRKPTSPAKAFRKVFRSARDTDACIIPVFGSRSIRWIRLYERCSLCLRREYSHDTHRITCSDEAFGFRILNHWWLIDPHDTENDRPDWLEMNLNSGALARVVRTNLIPTTRLPPGSFDLIVEADNDRFLVNPTDGDLEEFLMDVPDDSYAIRVDLMDHTASVWSSPRRTPELKLHIVSDKVNDDATT